MLSKGLGGLEQVFLDYNNLLNNYSDIEMHNCISYNANIQNQFQNKTECNSNLQTKSSLHLILNVFGSHDIIAKIQLKLISNSIKPDVIIAHGRRAIKFAKFIKSNNTKLIAICHDYYKKSDFNKCDNIIALTEHMRQYLIQNNISEKIISIIPNMIEINHDYYEKSFHNPIVIGAMGRFAKTKGIDVFIQALSILKNKGYEFKAVIAGDGPEKKSLINLSSQLDINDNISFLGWIKNKRSFFDAIDIFCVPSRHEPFGIIILEAMLYCANVIVTNAQGPSEIIQNKIDGMIAKIDSPSDLSNYIEYLINNPTIASQYKRKAFNKLKNNYSSEVIGQILYKFLINL